MATCIYLFPDPVAVAITYDRIHSNAVYMALRSCKVYQHD